MWHKVVRALNLSYISLMKSFLIFALFLGACSNCSNVNEKIKNYDSRYDKTMFNNTYFKYDTVLKTSITEKDTQYITYMYDYVWGVKNIGETVLNTSSDTTKEYHAFFVEKRLYKIYVIGFSKTDIGKRADYAKSLYHFDGDKLLSKSEYKLMLDLKVYREHFEHLAKNFNDTIKLKESTP